MGKPTAVQRFNAADSMQVLLWSLIMLYTIGCINDMAAPESIKALKHFPACTVTAGQSEISHIVNC